jgi:hypothetical protein
VATWVPFPSLRFACSAGNDKLGYPTLNAFCTVFGAVDQTKFVIPGEPAPHNVFVMLDIDGAGEGRGPRCCQWHAVEGAPCLFLSIELA